MDKKTKEFFDEYYSEYIKECNDIMFKHVNLGLKEIFDTYGKTSVSDAYRILAYASLKVLHSSFTEQLDEKDSVSLNEECMNIVDSLIVKNRESKSGKELIFTAPLIMMDILAFKEFEFEKSVDESEANAYDE